MRNYNEIYNRYVGYLSDESKRKQVMGKFAQLKLPDDIRAMLKACIFYNIYGTSMKNLLVAEGMSDTDADRMYNIAARITNYDKCRFNLALAIMNNTLGNHRKAYQDALGFIDRYNPDDYVKILDELCEMDMTGTRKKLGETVSTVEVTCSICGKAKNLNDVRFGRSVCKACSSDRKEDGKVRVTKTSLNNESKARDREDIEKFVSGENTQDTEESQIIRDRILRINSIRTLYNDACNSLLNRVYRDDIESKLNKLDIINKLILEEVK